MRGYVNGLKTVLLPGVLSGIMLLIGSQFGPIGLGIVSLSPGAGHLV